MRALGSKLNLADLVRVSAAASLLTLGPACGAEEPTTDEGGLDGDVSGGTSGVESMGEAGDGDGSTDAGDGDGSAGDGDGTGGDGDGTGGDGDGSSGDGDGTGDGDGDGSTGDGDGSAGDGDGTSGDGDGTSGDGDGDGCFEMTATLTPVRPYVLLVIDKSGSMLSNTFEDATMTQVTRWQGLYDVVESVATQFSADLQLGALLFPGVNVDPTSLAMACDIDSSPASLAPVTTDNGPTVIGLLPARDSVQGDFGGATPTHDALSLGYQHLMGLPDPSIPRAAILVTDGAANCNTADNSSFLDWLQTYDNRLSGLVSGAFGAADSIPTYIVGIGIDPGVSTCEGVTLSNCGAPWHEQGSTPTMSEIVPYDKLDALAVDGGAPAAGPPSFYSAANQTELEAELQNIATGLLSCVIELGAEPPFPESVTVDTGTTVWGPVTDCATEDGFVYLDTDTVELCNAACDELLVSGSAEVVFTCMPG